MLVACCRFLRGMREWERGTLLVSAPLNERPSLTEPFIRRSRICSLSGVEVNSTILPVLRQAGFQDSLILPVLLF